MTSDLSSFCSQILSSCFSISSPRHHPISNKRKLVEPEMYSNSISFWWKLSKRKQKSSFVKRTCVFHCHQGNHRLKNNHALKKFLSSQNLEFVEGFTLRAAFITLLHTSDCIFLINFILSILHITFFCVLFSHNY